MRQIWFQITMFFIFSGCGSQTDPGSTTMDLPEGLESAVFFGDSITTGAATHPHVEYDQQALWNLIWNGDIAPRRELIPEDMLAMMHVPADEETLDRATRIWPNKEQRLQLSYDRQVKLRAYRYLAKQGRLPESIELSWAYMTGRALGIKPDDIAIAAQGGARFADLGIQLERVSDTADAVFILFAGNDFCSDRLNEEKLDSSLLAFEEQLQEWLSSQAPMPKAVIILAPLDVSQHLTEPTVINKKVHAFGRTLTCQEFRDYNPSKRGFGAIFDQALAGKFGNLIPFPPIKDICPGLFDGKKSPDDLTQLKALQTRAVVGLESVVKRLGDHPDFANIVHFDYLKETYALEFNGSDIANDCFHLSPQGQAKVAERVLESL